MTTSSLSSATTCVTLHTSSETDTQMVALQQMFELLGSDEMVIAESDRTRTAAQGAFDKLFQDFQRVSAANESLRREVDQLTGQLSQLNREPEQNALQEEARLEKDEILRQCNENVVAATRRQLEAIQTAQDEALIQRETLETSHRREIEDLTSSHRTQLEDLTSSQRDAIATLNHSHQSTLSTLQSQLNEATDSHQTAVARLTQIEQEEQTMNAEVQTLTATLNQHRNEMPALQQRVQTIRTKYYR